MACRSWDLKIAYCLVNHRLKSVLKTSQNDNVYRKRSQCTLVKFHRNIFSPSGVKKNFNQEWLSFKLLTDFFSIIWRCWGKSIFSNLETAYKNTNQAGWPNGNWCQSISVANGYYWSTPQVYSIHRSWDLKTACYLVHPRLKKILTSEITSSYIDTFLRYHC